MAQAVEVLQACRAAEAISQAAVNPQLIVLLMHLKGAWRDAMAGETAGPAVDLAKPLPCFEEASAVEMAKPLLVYTPPKDGLEVLGPWGVQQRNQTPTCQHRKTQVLEARLG